MTDPQPGTAAVPPLLLAFALVAGLAACAGGRNVKPGIALAEAEAAVARAERARIGDYDPASWKAARENLAEARRLDGNTATDAAANTRWYAARAKADAELGLTRAERARLVALTQALKREVATLQAGAAPAVGP